MKLLIIEDNYNISNALRMGFEHKKVRTKQCSDGLSGLQCLIENFYDLAIIDLDLPEMNGEEIVERACKLNIKTPILVLTANTDANKKTKLLSLGAEDYMEKPYSFDELYARIIAILRRSLNSFPSEYLSIGNLKLVPETQTALRGKKRIKLSPKEYKILKFFMNHPNQMLSHMRIMKEIWGYAHDNLSNTVRSHILNLRNKIDKNHKTKLIHTVYGGGYIFSAEKSE